MSFVFMGKEGMCELFMGKQSVCFRKKKSVCSMYLVKSKHKINQKEDVNSKISIFIF